MIKGNLNIRQLQRIPGMRTFAVDGLKIATDGKAIALSAESGSFLGTIEECRRMYPSTMHTLSNVLPYLGV